MNDTKKPRSRTVLAAQAYNRIAQLLEACETTVGNASTVIRDRHQARLDKIKAKVHEECAAEIAAAPQRIRELCDAKIAKVKEALDAETLEHLERLLGEAAS